MVKRVGKILWRVKYAFGGGCQAESFAVERAEKAKNASLACVRM